MKALPSVGDRVRFAKAWLQATATYTGDVPRLRGTVTRVRTPKNGPALIAVQWDHPYFGRYDTNVLACNLEICKERKTPTR